MIREYINIVESLGKGITDEWFKDGGFKTYKRPAKEKYEVASEPGTINTLEGPVNILLVQKSLMNLKTIWAMEFVLQKRLLRLLN